MKETAMSQPLRRAVVGACLAVLAAAASADKAPRVAPLPSYQQECGACHVAYPPGLLPAASWQRVMDHLPQHYGTDASLDAATRAELARWLAANAGTYKRVGNTPPPEDRISRSSWFVRKHDEVPGAAWTRAAVKGRAHCSACHARADQGEFDEHDVRIPR
jgi:mono/diheme cytochrome c family protein